MLRTTDQRRYKMHQTYGGSALAAGRITSTAYDAYVAAGKVVPMGDATGFGRRDRGGIFQVASDGADNLSITVVVWAVVRLDAADFTNVDSYELRKIGTLTAVLSTAVGVAGSTLAPATVRLADAMTWSADSYGTFVKNLMGGAFSTYSNTSNVPGALGIADVGNCLGLIFEATTNVGTDKTAWVLSEVGT